MKTILDELHEVQHLIITARFEIEQMERKHKPVPAAQQEWLALCKEEEQRILDRIGQVQAA